MGRLWIDAEDGAAWLQRDGALVPWHGGQPMPADARVVVLVPGECVALHRIDVPARRLSELRQAVPFALEDRLAEPVESLHFAIGTRDGTAIEVGVVAKTRMAAWLSQVPAGTSPGAMVADAHLLPRRTDMIHLAQIGNRMLVGVSDAAWAMSVEDWRQWRHLLPTLPMHALDRDGTFHPLNGGEPSRLDRVDLLRATTPFFERAPDLLQGEFAPRARTARRRRSWRLATMLAGAAAALTLVEAAAGVFVQQQHHDHLRAEQASVFRQALPDARMTADPAAQLAAELGRAGASAGRSDALGLLLQVAPIVTQGSRYRIEAVDYRLDVLELEISTTDVASLDGLRESLATQGLAVEMTGVSPSENGMRGRLRLQEHTP